MHGRLADIDDCHGENAGHQWPRAKRNGGESARRVTHAESFVTLENGHFRYQNRAHQDAEQRDAGQSPSAMVHRTPHRYQRGLYEVEACPGEEERAMNVDHGWSMKRTGGKLHPKGGNKSAECYESKSAGHGQIEIPAVGP